MARKFQFDDEENIQETYQESSHIDELENMKGDSFDEVDHLTEYQNIEDTFEKESQPMAKKKKSFVWKWWHYAIIAFGVLGIAFMVYIFALSSNDGPVFGNRCEGIVTISKDLQTAASDTIKTKYSEVESITMETVCKQLKINIVYKEGMDTKKAQTIAEEAVLTLDGLVGKTKEEGKTYSTLFGKIDNVSQYEVNLYLTSQNSDDFPIYGTKHVQRDEFSYTLSSVKDEDSYNKAKDTLKK